MEDKALERRADAKEAELEVQIQDQQRKNRNVRRRERKAVRTAASKARKQDVLDLKRIKYRTKGDVKTVLANEFKSIIETNRISTVKRDPPDVLVKLIAPNLRGFARKCWIDIIKSVMAAHSKEVAEHKKVELEADAAVMKDAAIARHGRIQ